ncbi:hypothetical protein [Paraburkholderia sp. BR14320]|uniref:gp53-like domain-containing protein n=1 Tax=unclassified Paraburkholderia TaxID=2615204 RepID=UPI0034CE56B5
MFQTDQPSAVLTLPTPAAAGTQGYFTNGNPVSGVAPTILDADFMNMIMMELINVVTAAGLTPSKTNNSQLLAAIKAIGSTGQLTNPGFLRTPFGFVMQWGTITTSASADLAVIYPTPMPNATFSVFTSAQMTSAGAMTGWNSPTVNGFNINGWNPNGGNRAAVLASWLAIGK